MLMEDSHSETGGPYNSFFSDYVDDKGKVSIMFLSGPVPSRPH